MNGKCAFCGNDGPLMESHILPAFAYKWLKGRSGTGYIRNTEMPNRRVQDGLKLHWLCSQCEGNFSKHETAFANKVFHPWNNGVTKIPYETWLLRFCVSVSWRVLKYLRELNPNTSYTNIQLDRLAMAEAKWRAFLNDEIPHPGEFEQHLLIFDNVESATIPDLPSNFNRFMNGTITLDIVGSKQSVMTFAKLGKFIIFGIIQKGPNRWEGTKVNLKNGILKPGNLTLPIGLIDLFREKCLSQQNAMSGISTQQQEKIEAHIAKYSKEFVNSEQFKSINADIQMFGRRAVTPKRNRD